MNVFISGSTGRMGQEVKSCIHENPNYGFVGGMNRGQADPMSSPANVVIDFSLPEAMNSVVEFCKNNNLPLVSGTTGLKPEHNSMLIELSKTQPVFWAANMSFGIYVMSQLVKSLGSFQKEFSYKISETHHVKKVDAPSGTAIMLEKAAKSVSLPLGETESIREGDVFGVHSFFINGPHESIEIKHEAFSRKLFAQGALSVAQWLIEQKPGFYSMADFFDK